MARRGGGGVGRILTAWIAAGLGWVATATAQDDKVGDTPRESAARSEAVAPPGPAKPAYLDELWKSALDAAKVKPSDVAPDAEFLRRVYLDLLGRIPPAAEARAFLGSKDKTKRAKLVEALLNHPDHPKHFATLWRIILIGRTNQGMNVNPDALTTWLRRRFADNRPWNETVRELIAAAGSNKENGATNYTLAHMEDGAVNLTSRTTRVFLGQQIQCTQCHDHPSNDWKQTHFWGINAFYKAIAARPKPRTDPNTGLVINDEFELVDREIVSDEDRYSAFDRRNGLVGVVPPTYLDGRKIDPGEDKGRRTQLASFITETDNDDFARAFVNRLWAHFAGRGFVHPVDDFGDHNPPSNPELLDRLAADFQANGYNVRDLIRWITASRAYHLTSRAMYDNAQDEVLFSHMALKPLTPEELYESLLTATGADKVDGAGAEAARDQFARQFVSAFANDEGVETLNFQGTIPQALLMMNGDLIEKATGGRPGSFLGKLFDESKLQRDPFAYVVNNLYLSALSRLPSRGEMDRAKTFFRADPLHKPELVAEDLFWALLNSNEFILNH